MNSTCPQWSIQAGNMAFFITRYISSSIYTIISIPIHLWCLRAFRIQSKKEEAYLPQIFLTISRLFQALSTFAYSFTFGLWRSPSDPGSDWFKSSYIFMRFLAHFISPLHIFTPVLCEMLSLLMSADRFYALWKPIAYTNLKDRRRKQLAVFCVFISILASISDLFRGTLRVNEGGLYRVVQNYQFTESPLGKASIFIKNTIDALGLLALYVFNIGMLWCFRIRRLEAENVISNQLAKQRQEREKILFILTLCQSCFMTIIVTFRVTYFTMAFLFPDFHNCYGRITGPVMIDSVNMIFDILDFFCLVIISKQFRKILRDAIGCLKGNSVGTTVQARPIGEGQQRIQQRLPEIS